MLSLDAMEFGRATSRVYESCSSSDTVVCLMTPLLTTKPSNCEEKSASYRRSFTFPLVNPVSGLSASLADAFQGARGFPRGFPLLRDQRGSH